HDALPIFSAYQFDGTLDGYKAFVAYGDKVGDLSLYLSFNRLENTSQPPTFYYGRTPDNAALIPQNPLAVNGSIRDLNELGDTAVVYGDSGTIDNTTDNLKIKLGYDFGDWQSLLNVAYENRNALTNAPNSYLHNSTGETIWGGDVTEHDQTFTIPTARFGISETDRRSLSAGLRLKGEINFRTRLEANINHFAILDDETRTSARNPRAPR